MQRSEHEVLARRRASLPASGMLEALRSGDEDQGSSPSKCNSGTVSPYLGFVNPGSFKPNLESFSFSAHRAQPNTPRLEPRSPLVGPTDTARFPDSASSTGDSESEAEPVTPSDAVFSENVTDTPKMQEKDQQVYGTDLMLVDNPHSQIMA